MFYYDLYGLAWTLYLSTLDHALLVEHEEVTAAVKHRTSFNCKVVVAATLLLLKLQKFNT